MPEQITMTSADIDALAAKLDALADQLTDDERALLLEVFRRAGAAADDEVSGFSFSWGGGVGDAFSVGFTPARIPLSEGFRGAFSPGVNVMGGDSSGISITDTGEGGPK
jgi:hypothetical protein